MARMARPVSTAPAAMQMQSAWTARTARTLRTSRTAAMYCCRTRRDPRRVLLGQKDLQVDLVGLVGILCLEEKILPVEEKRFDMSPRWLK